MNKMCCFLYKGECCSPPRVLPRAFDPSVWMEGDHCRIMNEKLTLDDEAEFTWMFGHEFFLETSKGNFVWSDPEYSGDNTIRSFSGTYKDFQKQLGVGLGRYKGKHIIREYCGSDVKLP